MALTKIKLNTMVTGTLPDANIPDDITIDATTLSTNFTVTANNSTDETVYPIFVDGATGTQGAETDTGLTYNPSSGLLTSTGFSGNLTGTLQTAAQTNITSVGTLTGLTVGHNNITLQGTGETQLLVNAASGNNAGIRFQENGSNKWTIGNDQSNDSLFFYDFGASATRFSIDSSGNSTFAGDISVGGNTLNTWNSLHSAIQLGYGALAVRQNNNTTYLTNNLYYESSGSANVTYIHENEASTMMLSDGNMIFFNAPSGTGTATLTERLRVDTEGNVGIGSGSNTNSRIVRGFSANKGLVIETQQPAIQLVDTDNTGRYFTLAYEQSAKTVYMHNQSNGPFRFDTNGVERMELTGAGNLVIKTPTAASSNGQSLPGYLSFQGFGWDSDSGSDPIEGRITFAGSYGGTSAGAHTGGGVIPKLEFGIVNSGDAGSTSESLTTVMSVHGAQHDLTGGSVSIAGGQSTYSSLGIHTGGTNSYGATQGHHQNSAITIDFPNADQSFGCLRWRSHGNMEHFFGVVQVGSSSQGDFVWQGFNGSAYKEWMRLNKGGQLGINTADNYGDAPLHVVGEGDVDAFGYPQLVLEGNSHNYPGIVFRGSGGTHAAMRIENGDGYSFWTTDHSNASQNWNNRLRIAEDGTFTGSSSADISDRNLKKNIKSISNGLETIKKLQGRTFEWKVSSQMAEGVKYGLIAQELEEVLPDLVYNKTGIVEKEDGTFYKSVFMGGVIPVLIEAVKELSAKVEALENA